MSKEKAAGRFSESLIYKRHSIRKYADGAVTDEQLDHMMRAAMAAPSAMNAQPWEFFVCEDREKVACVANILKYGQMAKQAPMAIVPCIKRDVMDESAYVAQDMGASVENLLLAAVECGLGAVWCGVFPNEDRVEEIRKHFGIPQSAIPFCVVVVGVPAESREPASWYEAGRVHRGKW